MKLQWGRARRERGKCACCRPMPRAWLRFNGAALGGSAESESVTTPEQIDTTSFNGAALGGSAESGRHANCVGIGILASMGPRSAESDAWWTVVPMMLDSDSGDGGQ